MSDKTFAAGTVAIVGRPNVGKSKLFNRLTRSRKALVDDMPGLTRDRIFGFVDYVEKDQQYLLIDTGGFETKSTQHQPFKENIVWQQTELAMAQADIIIFLLDGKVGLHPHDLDLWRALQKQNKPIVCVVNKIDGAEKASLVNEFYQMGMDQLLPISAEHNRGVMELREQIEIALDRLADLDKPKTWGVDATAVALIGRPNVGKSSLVNRLLGEERVLVSDIPGTTRDAIDSPFAYDGHKYVLIDTAGIRRRSKIKQTVEQLSIVQSLHAIERADIVVLVLDALEGFTDQDARLATLTLEHCKPLLMVVNKWDLLQEKTSETTKRYEQFLKTKLGTHDYVPVMFVSCLQNQRVHKIFAKVAELKAAYQRRIGTAALNDLLGRMVQEHTPALINNHTKRIKFYYATQARTSPPTFVIKCNIAGEIQPSYQRYLQNRLRDELGFAQIPLRVLYRDKSKREQV